MVFNQKKYEKYKNAAKIIYRYEGFSEKFWFNFWKYHLIKIDRKRFLNDC